MSTEFKPEFEEELLDSGLTNFNELDYDDLSQLYATILILLKRDNPLNYKRILLLFMCLNEMQDVNLTKLINVWKENKGDV